MRTKVLMLLTALAVLVLLSGHALSTARRDEIYYTVEVDADKVDFLFHDVPRNGTLAGKRIGKGFVINVEIDGFYLDMYLQFDDSKRPTGYSILLLNKQNATGHEKTRFTPLILTKSAWDVCNATVGWAWTGITRTGNTCFNSTITVFVKILNGVRWALICVARWSMDGVEWTCDSVTCLVNWTWDTLAYLKEWAWERAARLTECVWYIGACLAERIWYGVSWMTGRVWEITAWPGNVFTEFYVGYLKGHVTRIMTLYAALTWTDALSLIVVNFCLLLIFLITRAVDMIRRRRQAQLEKEAADRLAAAAAAAEKKRQRNLNIKNRCNKKKYL